MKYLRFSFAAVFILLAAMTITACSGEKDKNINVDIKKMAEEIQTQSITSGELKETTGDIFASTYFVDMSKVDESAAYLSSASTACEIAVVKCKDSTYAAEVETLFKNRAESQSKLFATYDTTEAAKLDSAIVKTAGNYVVLCVVDDTAKAEEVLKSSGF